MSAEAMVEPPVPARVAPGSERVYWPQLDGLRFVAFFLVYLFHGGVPQFSGWVRDVAVLVSGVTGQEGSDLGYRLQHNGWVGVRLFFILSGYLITSLLLREEARFGRVDLRAFWVRRILRIWPLYYLVVFLGFGVVAWAQGVAGSAEYREQLTWQLPAFLLFLGNWSMGLFGPVFSDALSVLWSVCVEEQFYLLAPLLVAWVPRGGRLPVVAVLAGVAVLSRYLMASAGANELLVEFATVSQMDTLLSGVALAVLFERFPPGEWGRRAAGWVQMPLLILFGWLLSRPELAHGSVMGRTWDSVWIWLAGSGLVGVVLLHRGVLMRFLAHRWMVWLGRISYGLYMYHEMALMLGRWMVGRIGWFPNREILTSVFCLALTVGMASSSYYGFERPFLRLKRRWTRVASRPV